MEKQLADVIARLDRIEKALRSTKEKKPDATITIKAWELRKGDA